MKTIFDVNLDDKKLAWNKPDASSGATAFSNRHGLRVEEYDAENADSQNAESDTCNARLDQLRQHAGNHMTICATLLVLAMLQLLFMHYDMQIIASTYTVVLCPLVLAVYVRTPLTQVHVVFLHYASVYVLLAHYEQHRDVSWLLSCWAIIVFAHLALIHTRKDSQSSQSSKSKQTKSQTKPPEQSHLSQSHTTNFRAVFAALCGLVVVNATALALRLFMFERHTSENQDARHVSHLAHGGLLLLNAAAYAWLR